MAGAVTGWGARRSVVDVVAVRRSVVDVVAVRSRDRRCQPMNHDDGSTGEYEEEDSWDQAAARLWQQAHGGDEGVPEPAPAGAGGGGGAGGELDQGGPLQEGNDLRISLKRLFEIRVRGAAVALAVAACAVVAVIKAGVPWPMEAGALVAIVLISLILNPSRSRVVRLRLPGVARDRIPTRRPGRRRR